jgi:5-methylcytosine-specific restriction endonuclease McrA
MWRLAPPVATALDTYRTCVNSVGKPDLRSRLRAVEAQITAAADAYAVAAEQNQLHTIPRHNSIGGAVSRAEMSWLYERQMVPEKKPGRAVYDAILQAPEHGRCPLCGQRRVKTLDHHLPQNGYPSLTVVPINLIPACSDCNKAKLGAYPAAAAEEPIHPYFDPVDEQQWLLADVVAGNPAAVVFLVVPPAEWSATFAARVRRQFNTLELAELYGKHAAEELIDLRRGLADLLAAGGTEAVRQQLAATAASLAAAHRNHWRLAMYRALSVSNWYCSGGFNQN